MCENMPNENCQKPRQNDFFSICGSCLKGCCTGVRPPLTKNRKKIIRNFLETNRIMITDPFEDKEYSFPKETVHGLCVFWNKISKKCQVQPVKPETCVAGPVTFDINTQSKKIEWWLKKEASCPLAGELYRRREGLDDHLIFAKTEILRLVHDLDSKALRAILEIQEPETFKIAEDLLDDGIIAELKR